MMEKIIKTELGTIEKITLEKMNFLYYEVPNDIASQKKAWVTFESKFPSLTGRKMYGLDYDDKHSYRACSLILESDKGNTFGFSTFEFEGGSYIRLRLKSDPSQLFSMIAPAYALLIDRYNESIDWSRPFVEHYKSKSVLDIMLPMI